MTGLIHSVSGLQMHFHVPEEAQSIPYINHTHAPYAGLEVLQNGEGTL